MALREIFKLEEATGKSNLISKGLIALNISYGLPDLRILCQKFSPVIVRNYTRKKLTTVSARLTILLLGKLKRAPTELF